MLPEGDEKPAEQEAQTLALDNVADGAPGSAYFPAGQVNERQGPPLPVE